MMFLTEAEAPLVSALVLKVAPISGHGNVAEIVGKFGGVDDLRKAINQLQSALYVA